jgi:hypothetical protein
MTRNAALQKNKQIIINGILFAKIFDALPKIDSPRYPANDGAELLTQFRNAINSSPRWWKAFDGHPREGEYVVASKTLEDKLFIEFHAR